MTSQKRVREWPKTARGSCVRATSASVTAPLPLRGTVGQNHILSVSRKGIPGDYQSTEIRVNAASQSMGNLSKTWLFFTFQKNFCVSTHQLRNSAPNCPQKKHHSLCGMLRELLQNKPTPTHHNKAYSAVWCWVVDVPVFRASQSAASSLCEVLERFGRLMGHDRVS